jgi:hypothetical protein
MPGVVIDLPHRALLDDFASVHHRHPVAHLSDDTQIVGDENQRHAGLALQVFEEIEVLQLDGDVQIGGRLVGDDAFGPA